MTTDDKFDVERRQKLRAVFDALAKLDAECPTEGFVKESLAVEAATEALKDGFPKDFIGTCEGCSCILLAEDEGQRCTDGEQLCKDCASSWGDIKEQWDDGTLSDGDDGDKAKFLARYDAHIAGGGKPDNLLTYPL